MTGKRGLGRGRVISVKASACAAGQPGGGAANVPVVLQVFARCLMSAESAAPGTAGPDKLSDDSHPPASSAVMFKY